MKRILQKIIKWFTKKHLKRFKKGKKVFNTTPSPVDKRDYIYTEITAENVPTKHLIWNRPTVRHQQSIGSCASHSIIRAYEILLKYQDGDRYIELSELYHYYKARKHVNKTFPADKGMTVRDACSTMLHYGNALEMLWPYDIKKFNEEPNQLSKTFARLYKIKQYERVYSIHDIKNSLRENNPVFCGVWVDDEYFSLNKNKYLWKPKGNKRGGHAHLIIGYDDVKGVFVMENSWGSDFGKDGCCEISYEDFRKVSFDWFRIVI